MKFTLQYQGPLPSNGTAKEKQRVRRAFHAQLAQLWKQDYDLSRYVPPSFHCGIVKGNQIVFEPEVSHTRGDLLIAALGEYLLCPLVRHGAGTACELRIKFLRPGPSGQIVQSGDIDNRLKTLLDALRIPQNLAELAGATPVTSGELFYCLLEDDSLITSLTVETDRLLLPDVADGDVTLYIEVALTEGLGP